MRSYREKATRMHCIHLWYSKILINIKGHKIFSYKIKRSLDRLLDLCLSVRSNVPWVLFLPLFQWYLPGKIRVYVVNSKIITALAHSRSQWYRNKKDISLSLTKQIWLQSLSSCLTLASVTVLELMSIFREERWYVFPISEFMGWKVSQMS